MVNISTMFTSAEMSMPFAANIQILRSNDSKLPSLYSLQRPLPTCKNSVPTYNSSFLFQIWRLVPAENAVLGIAQEHARRQQRTLRGS